MLADGGDDHGTEGNVIDEVAIHDVAVNPVRAGFVGQANLFRKAGEIGREDGRSDEDGMGHLKGNVQRPTFNVQCSMRGEAIGAF